MKYALIVIPFILSACSECNGQNKSETKIAIPLSKDIPSDKQGLPIRSYIFKNKLVNKAHLEMLENGFDSLQLRIWYNPAYVDSVYLLVIKNLNGTWYADVSDYKIMFNKNRNTIDSIIGRSIKVNPKSGWQFFLDRIFNLEVATLPDIDAIIESRAMADDGGVAVEVSTKFSYRFYHYLKSTLCNDSIPQTKKMESIMRLVKQEFDFVFPDCQSSSSVVH